MILTLDLTSDVPLYQQLRDRITEEIAEGRLVAGSALPPTRALAADFGINFHTVNKAYDLLRRQGLIRLNRRTGAVVAVAAPGERYREEWTGRARTLLAEAIARGMSAGEVLAECRSLIESFESQRAGDEP
ncbi:GntR family transcriptional regulator [Arthrobacter sp. C152]